VWFYGAIRMYSSDYAVARCLFVYLSVCLSICPSVRHTPVLCRNGIKLFHYLVAIQFCLFRTGHYGKILTGPPNWGVEC